MCWDEIIFQFFRDDDITNLNDIIFSFFFVPQPLLLLVSALDSQFYCFVSAIFFHCQNWPD